MFTCADRQARRAEAAEEVHRLAACSHNAVDTTPKRSTPKRSYFVRRVLDRICEGAAVHEIAPPESELPVLAVACAAADAAPDAVCRGQNVTLRLAQPSGLLGDRRTCVAERQPGC
jgi:hypothetical protein